MSSCTGHCCRKFWLSKANLDLLTDPDPERHGQDEEIILDMVIWLEWYHNDDGEFAGGRFTCKHLDQEAGRCTNYENRPQMCRNFPYGGDCPFSGCTMPKDEQLGTKKSENPVEEPCSTSGN